MVQCKVERCNRETNGLSHTQMVQCNVEWFNWDWSGGTMKHIVLREIRWFHMTYNSWRRNHQKYKSEIWTNQDWSCLVFVAQWGNVLYQWRERMLTILLRAMPLGPRFVSFTISRLISQAANLVSCTVNFQNVCPFLHLHRLPFRQILKTTGFVGRFLLSEGWSFICCGGGGGASHFEKAEIIFKPSPPNSS